MIYVDEIERDTSLKSENEERKQKISVLKKNESGKTTREDEDKNEQKNKRTREHVGEDE